MKNLLAFGSCLLSLGVITHSFRISPYYSHSIISFVLPKHSQRFSFSTAAPIHYLATAPHQSQELIPHSTSEDSTNLEMTKAAKLQKLVRSSKGLKPDSVTRFFKTGKGTYGEHDKFLGMSMPDLRKLAKEHKDDITLEEIQKLLESEYNDERCLALVILVEQYQQAGRDAGRRQSSSTTDDENRIVQESERKKKEIYDFYLLNTKYINNWNLVDVSCYFIIGEYLKDKTTAEDRKVLHDLTESSNLWERRIAIVSTMAFIRNNEIEETFIIAKKLLHDEHDLIHKAVGWLLREAGKRNVSRLTQYLDENCVEMPKTMLRYAIEKFPAAKQKAYLKKQQSKD